jgi:hypothetical protein
MKYGIGDRVRVVNFGANIWRNHGDGKFEIIDIRPEVVGKEGIICKAELTQDVPTYAIEGIPEKHAWYSEDQLEMVNPNPNVH